MWSTFNGYAVQNEFFIILLRSFSISDTPLNPTACSAIDRAYLPIFSEITPQRPEIFLVHCHQQVYSTLHCRSTKQEVPDNEWQPQKKQTNKPGVSYYVKVLWLKQPCMEPAVDSVLDVGV